MSASARPRVWRHGAVRVGGAALAVLAVIALAAPWLGTVDPSMLNAQRVNAPVGSSALLSTPDGRDIAHTMWMGGDFLGRDIYSRVVYGTRISLLIGAATALAALCAGAPLGLVAGYVRWADTFLMRAMDGLMAIPAILLAMTLVAVLGAKPWAVVLAIALPEVPRVARLVRSQVLRIRTEAFVEAARGLATPAGRIVLRHVLPHATTPLIVQGTFIAASAVLTEASLSFLGLGLPADLPTWGNLMAEGRAGFSQFPGHVFFPALFLVPTVLAVLLLGDGLHDILDPHQGSL